MFVPMLLWFSSRGSDLSSGILQQPGGVANLHSARAYMVQCFLFLQNLPYIPGSIPISTVRASLIVKFSAKRQIAVPMAALFRTYKVNLLESIFKALS